MIRSHKLAIYQKYADEIVKGNKTFEIRKNYPDYKVGELVSFYAVEESEQERFIPHAINDDLFVITYVLDEGDFPGIAPGYCVFGIRSYYESKRGEK